MALSTTPASGLRLIGAGVVVVVVVAGLCRLFTTLLRLSSPLILGLLLLLLLQGSRFNRLLEQGGDRPVQANIQLNSQFATRSIVPTHTISNTHFAGSLGLATLGIL